MRAARLNAARQLEGLTTHIAVGSEVVAGDPNPDRLLAPADPQTQTRDPEPFPWDVPPFTPTPAGQGLGAEATRTGLSAAMKAGWPSTRPSTSRATSARISGAIDAMR
jgi:hypothetical protein